MRKVAITLVGFIIIAALFWWATGADAASDLGHILLPALGAMVVVGLAIGIAPLFNKSN